MDKYAQKLQNMRERRLGNASSVAFDSLSSSFGKSAAFNEFSGLTETYEKRTEAKSVKYALGAMQELDERATKISYAEADRIKNQLQPALESVGIKTKYEIQGSVALNIHIRLSSDIDILTLHDDFLTYDSSGPRASTYYSVPWTPIHYINNLRNQAEKILEEKFPSAKVDKSGAKSISISGGSLQRKIDVVPSHWYDTAEYQRTQEKHHREVNVLDKKEQIFISNRPFLHIKMINDKDISCAGGAKKVIRLLKSLKRDSSRSIQLTSYDIAALIWHMPTSALIKQPYLELSLIAETQLFLQDLVNRPTYATSLVTPDGSRKIIDTVPKLDSISLLKLEVDELAADIEREINPSAIYRDKDSILRKLRESVIL